MPSPRPATASPPVKNDGDDDDDVDDSIRVRSTCIEGGDPRVCYHTSLPKTKAERGEGLLRRLGGRRPRETSLAGARTWTTAERILDSEAGVGAFSPCRVRNGPFRKKPRARAKGSRRRGGASILHSPPESFFLGSSTTYPVAAPWRRDVARKPSRGSGSPPTGAAAAAVTDGLGGERQQRWWQATVYVQQAAAAPAAGTAAETTGTAPPDIRPWLPGRARLSACRAHHRHHPTYEPVWTHASAQTHTTTTTTIPSTRAEFRVHRYFLMSEHMVRYGVRAGTTDAVGNWLSPAAVASWTGFQSGERTLCAVPRKHATGHASTPFAIRHASQPSPATHQPTERKYWL
ncbi:hypothetical protein PCL_02155 [Purpureocillium lilacinum]|uniref:Uncharacterized protein n=1 Tax=Purpureocillium lilacinum TaxID=33203 RepID=A0A2U3E1N3_PURLI|nr:hypothetical protein PCL_02155 [Purpureocillium lilacinum]